MNNRWFNISFSFPNEYFCFSVLRIIATGIRAITNTKGNRESPWNIPHIILTFPNLFFPENKTVLQHCIILFSSSIMFILFSSSMFILFSSSIMFVAVPTSSRVFVLVSVSSSEAPCHMLFENQPMPHSGLLSFSYYS